MPPPKLTINHHPRLDGQGDPIKPGRTYEAKADGSDPELLPPNPFRIPRLAVSMTVEIDDGEQESASYPANPLIPK